MYVKDGLLSGEHLLMACTLDSRGRYSTDVWVGRCGWGAQTLTLFKTEISDFPTLFKTSFRVLRPRLNTFNQKSLSSFVVVQASGVSTNKKGYKFGFLYHFYMFKRTRFPFKCKETQFKTKKVMKSIHRLRQKTMKSVPYLAARLVKAMLLGVPPPHQKGLIAD